MNARVAMNKEIARKKINAAVSAWSYRQGKHCLVCSEPIRHLSTYCNKHALRWNRKPTDEPRITSGYLRRRVSYSPIRWDFEHRFVWEQVHGEIPSGWNIHHINGVKLDNRIENLVALPTKCHNHGSPTKMLLKKARQRINQLESQLNSNRLF